MNRVRLTPLHLMLLGCAAVVLLGALLSPDVSHAGGAMSQPPGPPASPGAPSSARAQGIPSIAVRPELAMSAAAHFTEADVRQYFATHRPPATASGSPDPTIISIQFLPAREVSVQLQGESMGVPDSTLLCLVRLSGTFTSPGYGPNAAQMTAASRDHAEMVFDAQTGNLLVSSAG